MPVALGTSGMTEDTLALQQKLSARTLRRGFASNKSATGEKEEKRGEKPHGCAGGIPLTVGKTRVIRSLHSRSDRAAGTPADRYEALRTPAQTQLAGPVCSSETQSGQ